MLYFQDIITRLQTFWTQNGCSILQPFDRQVGAGTFHPATVLRCLEDRSAERPWRICYVQPSRRPTDSRYGKHPNRAQHYYQFQVILQPSPIDIQDLYLESLRTLGLNPQEHDIRFIEDDWKSPTLGAWGLGWEVWCDGMEITQFTYMQEIGEVKLSSIPGEITYGLERLALYIQNKESFAEIEWSDGVLYKDLEVYEEQNSIFNLELTNQEKLRQEFTSVVDEAKEIAKFQRVPAIVYDYCIRASHIFNLIDARGLNHIERESYIAQVKELAKIACSQWRALYEERNKQW
ncbi:Glycine--tRNA ligase alpha subunit [Rickettsiales endosymbiont of Paramecium tredecaurelia]|uniref:glycine--tRNA ligase subunit alpha n=1 Tax=Candidatus Sarmatiella mevalonica TaxID=2770581 RepID=UPI001922F363|nr:glycine--tRNA ligase subunit alpha [Candidatus Sarmatiella mevalonica]MBL3285020.1 Glycine--tRNA ligase alpha subunit [Candidatus Sarmatiella mevalonica]